MEHASRTLRFGARCALMFLPVRTYTCSKSHTTPLTTGILSLMKTLPKEGRRKKRIILKLGLEWVEEGVHFKYCYIANCQGSTIFM